MKLVSGIDMDLLLTLDALHTDQNITHAALRLGISQPAMSARLARLRNIFQDRLFIPSPNGRGVLPTPRSMALIPALRNVLEGISTMLEPAVFDPVSSNRTFVVALHENPALMLGSDLFNRLCKLAPHVRLRFILPDSDHLSHQMENNGIDIYIGISKTADDSWIGRQLFTDEFATAQRKSHPRGQGPLDLLAYCSESHLVVSSDGDPFTGFVDYALKNIGQKRLVAMSTQSYAMVPSIVGSTNLLCTLPNRLLQRFVTILDIFEPPIALPPISISAYWHPRNHEDPTNRWFRSQIFQTAGLTND